MKVLEIKNNLIKVLYDIEDTLTLGQFLVIEDEKHPYVGQIVSLKADSGISYAIIRLLFTFNEEGIVKNYDGSIPKLEANATRLTPDELLDILPIEKPIQIGNIAQQNFLLKLDCSILKNNLLICADNAKNVSTLVSNFTKQSENNAESSIVFDIDGKFNYENKFKFGEDFKLPLNFETINYIYGNDLNDITPTSKAIIQDIFLEVQEYTRTIPDKYIPFDTFINVVDSQYRESNIPELALLKNKLLKYKEENVFAQSKSELTNLKEYIKDNYTTVIDISNVEASLQKEIITYVYNTLDEMGAEIYSYIKINDKNSDKKLLKMFLDKKKVFTTIVCNHTYKYVYELKENSENIIVFAPETTQHDFAAYNTFLNKLNHDEFIIWGAATQRIPLIIELAPLEIVKPEPVVQVVPEVQQVEEVAEPEEEEVETEEEVSEAAVPLTADFTDNEDTYTDLSDAVDRKRPEEEVEEVKDVAENPVEVAELTPKKPEQNEEAPTNNFFTVAELQETPEVTGTPLVQEVEPEHEEVEEEITEEPKAPVEEEPSENFENIDIVEEVSADFEDEALTPLEEETPMEEGIQSEEEIEYENFEPLEEEFEPEIEEEILDEELEDEEVPFEQEEDELNLPAPEIDERIAEDFEEFEDEEQPVQDEEQIQEQGFEEAEQTPFENSDFPEPAALIQEDEFQEMGMVNMEIEDEERDDLTEDDLNFIDDINNGDHELLEPVVDTPIQETMEEYEEEETPQPVPLYKAETPVTQQSFEQGDHVMHPKYGEGIVEKMLRYGNKTLCSINFVNIGRRLLDPAISEISKV